VALTDDWDAGAHEIRAETFESDVATGTAPLIVASETLVANFNADLLDGSHAAAFAGATHASDHTTGGGDELDADKADIDWNPSNYTPATDPAEADSVDNLTAHLYGIDQSLGAKKYRWKNITFDGGGSAVAAGTEIDVVWPAGTIKEYVLLGDRSGSIKIDLWKCTYAQFDNSTHPVDGDSICAAAAPEISSAHKAADSTLTDWTTALTAGDIIRAHVDSCTTTKRAVLAVKIELS